MPTVEQAVTTSRAVPMKPLTPPSLTWLNDSSLATLWKLDPERDLADWAPLLKEYRAELQVYLQPAAPDWVVTRITALMGHWWTPSLQEDQLRIMALDWAKALQDIPQFALEEGIGEYLKTHRRKPTPHDIREAALKVTADERNMILRIDEALKPPPRWS